jgi:hypothetical protein
MRSHLTKPFQTKRDRTPPKLSKPNAIALHKILPNQMRSHFTKISPNQMRSHLTKPLQTKCDRTSQNPYNPNAIATHKTLQTKCDHFVIMALS